MSVEQIAAVVSNHIGSRYEQCRNSTFVDSISPEDHRRIKATYRRRITAMRNDVFERLPMDAVTIRRLHELSVSIFTRAWIDPPYKSGVVFAGYGHKDFFPCLRAVELTGVVGGYLCYKHMEMNSVTISLNNTATIVPFAQSEMVRRFMEGVDPDYQSRLRDDFAAFWGVSLAAVIQAIQELTPQLKEFYRTQAEQIAREQLNLYFQHLEQFGRRAYIGPVMEIVESLPKDELAEMAESLVNLTSLKRKMSTEKETVGGPVDVAVISKGDGFVWIKRKHYFRPELNPQFFANYYRESRDEDRQED